MLALVPWDDYLTGFHRDRAGITETVLRASRDSEGITPYGWLLAAVPDRGLVLDLAAGSAPLWPTLAARRYVGLDTSAAELAAARRTGAGPLVRASATAIPLAGHSVDVVVCSMALMIVTPLPRVLAEIHRILVPGGHLVATVPARGPLRARDLPVLGGLLATLGRGLTYPNDDELGDLRTQLMKAGLSLDSDERRRFGYRLDNAAHADGFLASLYLPDLPSARYRLARAYLRGLARIGVELPIPIRRVVAIANR